METTQQKTTPKYPETGKKTLSPKRLTPLQKLLIERQEIRKRCQEEQQQVTEQWQYIRKNSKHLIVSGISSMFFPRYKRHKHHKEEDKDKKQNKSEYWQNIKENLPYYLAVAREGFYLTWYLVRPFYIKWVMSRKK